MGLANVTPNWIKILKESLSTHSKIRYSVYILTESSKLTYSGFRQIEWLNKVICNEIKPIFSSLGQS